MIDDMNRMEWIEEHKPDMWFRTGYGVWAVLFAHKAGIALNRLTHPVGSDFVFLEGASAELAADCVECFFC